MVTREVPDVPGTGLGSSRFSSFLVVQFLGAANDNAFKYTLSLLILATVPTEAEQVRYTGLATALFPLPFLIFSPLAGYLADRFGKDRMVLLTKAPEILVMILAVVGFATGDLRVLLFVLFALAMQSTFFSPVKYGLLPESLEHRDLSMGNGILQMTTNLAILFGSIVGLQAFSYFEGRLERAGWFYVALAVVGTLAATHVPRTPPGNPASALDWNPFGSFAGNWRIARRTSALFQSMLGIAFYWMLGSVLLAILPIYGKNVLGASVRGAGLMLMVLSVGIAVGSIAAGKLSRGRVELGLVPLGSLGLTLFILDLAFFGHLGPPLVGGLPARACLDLSLLGVAGGLFIIPLNALVQQRTPSGEKGRLIAFSNLLAFGAVLAAAGAMILLTDVLGWSSHRIVLAAGVVTLAVTIYIVALLPDFLVRLVLWILTNTVYRIRVVGDRNIPSGGALLVANHVSWVDALLIGSACDRHVRFLMFRPFFEAPLLSGLFRRMHVIPVAATDTPEQKEASLARARAEIEEGHLVCIFAEGAITRTGNLLRFRRGFERIARGMNAPIVPICLDGVWGSLFSYERGRVLLKWPSRVLAPVRVIFGEPMASSSRTYEVRQAMQELSAEGFRRRESLQRPLHEEFLRRARRYRRRAFLIGSDGRTLTFGHALVHVLALRAALFGKRDRDPGRVGILLPTGVDSVLVNLAALAAGGVVVNLDVDSAPDLLRRRIERIRPSVVVTSEAAISLLAGRRVPGGCRVALLDEATSSVPKGAVFLLHLLCRILPGTILRGWVLRGVHRDVDRAAAVVFPPPAPSGRERRAVLLSHRNLLANVESIRQVFRLTRSDRVLGVVRLSSSFGLTGTLLAPAFAGVAVILHDDPMDGKEVGRLAATHGITVVPVAPAHLEAYDEAIPTRFFSRLRRVVTAGGVLAPQARTSFASKFGVEPLEGFGCEECASLISLNIPAADPRLGQLGTTPGTLGHPLPGVAVKIVDSRSGAVLPPDASGRLMIKGPSVMLGYVDDETGTARDVRDGWFRSSYLARLDVNGFLADVEAANAD